MIHSRPTSLIVLAAVGVLALGGCATTSDGSGPARDASSPAPVVTVEPAPSADGEKLGTLQEMVHSAMSPSAQERGGPAPAVMWADGAWQVSPLINESTVADAAGTYTVGFTCAGEGTVQATVSVNGKEASTTALECTPGKVETRNATMKLGAGESTITIQMKPAAATLMAMGYTFSKSA